MKAEVVYVREFSDKTFVLTLRPEEKFEFKAGQFVMLKTHRHSKPFSIASHPSDKYLEFLIKEHDDGEVTPFLLHARTHSHIEVEGPFGVFTVKDTQAKEILFMATGTGVAPFRSMVTEALRKFPDKKVTLVFGFRREFFFEEIWKDLTRKYKNFSYYAYCSKPEATGWKGACGRITDHLSEVFSGPEHKEVYICGNAEVVECVKEQLISVYNFDTKQIHVEEWHEEHGGARGVIGTKQNVEAKNENRKENDKHKRSEKIGYLLKKIIQKKEQESAAELR